MTIKQATLPKDERGNDPNDHKDDANYLAKLKPQKINPDMDWADKFVLSDSEANMLAAPEWIYRDLIIRGHVGAFSSEANGGKTTVFLHIAGEISNKYQVYYVNADVSGGDAKSMVAMAKEKGFTLLLPDMKVGLSMDDVVQHLSNMNQSNADYSDYVFIFDTLKKMTDVINKSRAKELFKLLRSLSAKGMTVVLLCHTNKYNDADGRPIYEGTGDLRSDVDELIYLIPKKNEDGSMTVSTLPDKVRGSFKPITFEISADREVSLSSEFVDVAAANKSGNQLEKDQLIIEAITETIATGKIKQTEIIKSCKDDFGLGWRTVQKALNRYSRSPNKLWIRKRALQNNAWNYQFPNQKDSPIPDGESEKW